MRTESVVVSTRDAMIGGVDFDPAGSFANLPLPGSWRGKGTNDPLSVVTVIAPN